MFGASTLLPFGSKGESASSRGWSLTFISGTIEDFLGSQAAQGVPYPLDQIFFHSTQAIL
jgi:hypothetical protein